MPYNPEPDLICNVTNYTTTMYFYFTTLENIAPCGGSDLFSDQIHSAATFTASEYVSTADHFKIHTMQTPIG